MSSGVCLISFVLGVNKIVLYLIHIYKFSLGILSRQRVKMVIFKQTTIIHSPLTTLQIHTTLKRKNNRPVIFLCLCTYVYCIYLSWHQTLYQYMALCLCAYVLSFIILWPPSCIFFGPYNLVVVNCSLCHLCRMIKSLSRNEKQNLVELSQFQVGFSLLVCSLRECQRYIS